MNRPNTIEHHLNFVLLCQITTKSSRDPLAVPLSHSDFASGSLPVASYIRPARIFTADKNIIIRKAGTVKTPVLNTVIKNIISLLQ